MLNKKSRWLYPWAVQKRKALAKKRRRGDALRDAKDFRGAVEAYSNYLLQVPSDFDIWVQKGNCAKDAGDYVTAHAAYGTAQSLRPDDADLYMQFGHLYKLQGKLDQALQSYENSAKLSPGNEVFEEVKYVSSLLKQRNAEKAVVRHAADLHEKDRPAKLAAASERHAETAAAKKQDSGERKDIALFAQDKIPVLVPAFTQPRTVLQQDAMQARLLSVSLAISRQAPPAGGK